MSAGLTLHTAPRQCLCFALTCALALVLTACRSEQQSAAATEPVPTPGASHAAAPSLGELIEAFVTLHRSNPGGTDLKPVTVTAFLADIEKRRELLVHIKALKPDGLTLDEDIDRRVMIGMLEAEIYDAEAKRIWENDPALYVPARKIGMLVEPASEEPEAERATRLGDLLLRVPDRLVLAQQNLKNPPERFTRSAIFQVQGTLESLRSSETLAPGSAEGSTLAAARKSATAGLETYLEFLEKDLLPRSTGEWAVGAEHYEYLLRHRWQMDVSADDILARGLKAFQETEALAQAVAERIEPGKHWSDVYEKLKDDHPPADGIKAAYQASIEEAQRFVIEHQIVTLPPGERVVTVDTPPAMRRSSPFGTFQSVDRFGTDLEGRLVLTPIEDWMTEEQRAARLRSHHHAWIPIIAVHEAYPGHHVDGLKVRENPRLLRKVVREPIFSEGWGLWTEELMFELGFLVGDDVRLTQLRNRLWRAARVILDVSLHTGKMTFDEAVDFLAEKVRFERYAAELEVGMYTVRPTYVLGYLIGMQELIKIRDEYYEKFGTPDSPSEFFDRLLKVGALPPVFVRESLLSGGGQR